MTDYDLTYLSLGAGVQSSALLVCSVLGLHGVPKIDVAIFADTGDEPNWVYSYLDILENWSPIPIVRVSKGRLSHSVIENQKNGNRFVSVPLYTYNGPGKKEGHLRRQCTREFKVEPIYHEVRRQVGLKRYERFYGRVCGLVGISFDEVQRMRDSKVKWIEHKYPLVDAGLTREDCKRIVTEAGLPEPKRSSCVFCPYHSDEFWQDLKDNHPEEWTRAIEFDEQIRDMTMRGRAQPAFVHRSCKPLGEVVLKQDEDFQLEMFMEECEGMCGV